MILLRTDGSGASYNDERLIALKAILKVMTPETEILKLHDHKGCLNVYWISTPTKKDMDLIEEQWENFCELREEVKHFFGFFIEFDK